MQGRRITTVSLDLDDTLWAIGPVIERAEKRLAGWLGERYPSLAGAYVRERVLEIRASIVDEHRDRAHDMTFLRREIIARIGRAHGHEVDVDQAFAVFDEARNDLALYPDVRPVLESLRGRFRLIAVTNGNANLDKIGIGDLFDGFVSAREVGAAKPAAAMFEAAVVAGGGEPASTVHVGDHPEMDVAGAQRAGIAGIWINRNGHDWPVDFDPPDGVIEDLHGLASLLGT